MRVEEIGVPAVGGALDTALCLQAGLKAWAAVDRDVKPSSLKKVFRDNWDSRVGKVKFGGVWSVPMARTNFRHPASEEALRIPRHEWSGSIVTVDHAIPVTIMFGFFWNAKLDVEMQRIVDAYAVAAITREEDERLRNEQLSMKMPKGWEFGKDPLARWKHVGIEVALIRRHGLVHVEQQ